MEISDLLAMHSAPRCNAKSKRTGKACRAPAVRGWKVCRMHGAGGGAKPGKAHPNYVHGARSAEAASLQKLVSAMGRRSRNLIKAIDTPQKHRIETPKGDN